MRPPRSRARLAALAVVVAALGLGSRRFASFLPHLVAAYAGDTLWALEVYLGILLLRPSSSTRSAAAPALGFSLLIETSQLYHAPWIDALRSQPIGGLILGFGFLWSDLVCYAAGVGLGVLVDACVFRTDARHQSKDSRSL